MNEVFSRMHSIMKNEGRSQQEMAHILGISAASISHMISGRNNPGLEVVRSFSKHYPTVDLIWLLNGEEMKSSDPDPLENTGIEQQDLKEIILVFEDDTFKILKPRK